MFRQKAGASQELLEDVFGLILRFAAMVRNDDITSDDHNEKVQTMYKSLENRLAGSSDICRRSRMLRHQQTPQGTEKLLVLSSFW